MDNKQIVQDLINRTIKNIDSCTEAQVKSDMKLAITSLIEFIGTEQPKILNPETPEDQIGKLFFKMVGGIAADALTAFLPSQKKALEQKFENVMAIYPLLKKYSQNG